MTPGERFNPRGIFRGVYIPDAIAEIDIHTLSMGAKVCYARLCWFAEENADGDAVASVPQLKLAASIGVKERQVRNYLDELKAQHFINENQRGLNLPNEYGFLWHELFSRSLTNKAKKALASDRQDSADPKEAPRDASDRQENCISLPVPPLLGELELKERKYSPDADQDQPLSMTMKIVKTRYRDATGNKLPTDVARRVEEIVGERGADLVIDITERFKAHLEERASGGTAVDRPALYFLGCLRKWEPASVENSDGFTPAITFEARLRPPLEPVPAGSNGTPPPPAPFEDFFAKWNAGPCEQLRLKVNTNGHERGFARAWKTPLFRESWETVIANCHAAKMGTGWWVSLSWLFSDKDPSGDRWKQALNNDFGGEKPADARQSRRDEQQSALDRFKAKVGV